ncbi:hypothetical protein [Micromonospora sp. NPDC049102]|uniref:hypothetical protein n=1 Tax=Micromonospora sp. NPDC049102 TaxID=3364265 RepID=UPI0037146C75
MIDVMKRHLLEAVPVGVHAKRSQDWNSFFSKTGMVLPEDYVWLVGSYGCGRFDEYLYLLEPGCPNVNYELMAAVKERREAFDWLWQEGEPKPPELQVEGSEFIPWASTDNGEFLYWRSLPGLQPSEWTVLISEARGEQWEHYQMGCVEFLAKALTREITSEILSPEFPLATHLFEPIESLA